MFRFHDFWVVKYNTIFFVQIPNAASAPDVQYNDDVNDSKSTESSGSDWIIGFGLVSLLWLTSVGIAVFMDR